MEHQYGWIAIPKIYAYSTASMQCSAVDHPYGWIAMPKTYEPFWIFTVCVVILKELHPFFNVSQCVEIVRAAVIVSRCLGSSVGAAAIASSSSSTASTALSSILSGSCCGRRPLRSSFGENPTRSNVRFSAAGEEDERRIGFNACHEPPCRDVTRERVSFSEMHHGVSNGCETDKTRRKRTSVRAATMCNDVQLNDTCARCVVCRRHVSQ